MNIPVSGRLYNVLAEEPDRVDHVGSEWGAKDDLGNTGFR